MVHLSFLLHRRESSFYPTNDHCRLSQCHRNDEKTDGVTFRDADSLEATQRYLLRNPGLSFVAIERDTIVGCIMSGHDGRRGYLQHLVVLPTHRKRGIASRLVENCLAGLERLGIQKSHIDVLQENHSAHRYWEGRGWKLRTDIRRYSFLRSGSVNA
ncbi:GNAT family N-acetyltransferase [Paenalcaligenes niemegkensis]|uniref:GNAT family N-acetyltransferase n=1 Tax=Paenalcaligenes niemegkensis TaxID=2895469 RepID=UPI001EE7D203|nr:GNAT family N-acetyltransferase [Paenalcaligenes niemegkensis]MCQ9616412.1 GNAT family N-acetyltransferase [Paenalcaligenes niemegkensis]